MAVDVVAASASAARCSAGKRFTGHQLESALRAELCTQSPCPLAAKEPRGPRSPLQAPPRSAQMPAASNRRKRPQLAAARLRIAALRPLRHRRCAALACHSSFDTSALAPPRTCLHCLHAVHKRLLAAHGPDLGAPLVPQVRRAQAAATAQAERGGAGHEGGPTAGGYQWIRAPCLAEPCSAAGQPSKQGARGRTCPAHRGIALCWPPGPAAAAFAVAACSAAACSARARRVLLRSLWAGSSEPRAASVALRLGACRRSWASCTAKKQGKRGRSFVPSGTPRQNVLFQKQVCQEAPHLPQHLADAPSSATLSTQLNPCPLLPPHFTPLWTPQIQCSTQLPPKRQRNWPPQLAPVVLLLLCECSSASLHVAPQNRPPARAACRPPRPRCSPPGPGPAPASPQSARGWPWDRSRPTGTGR